jgi:hypothetical protein
MPWAAAPRMSQGLRVLVLEIICMPEELESDRLPELKKVLAETNEAYRRYAQEETRTRQAELENARRQEAALSGLKDRLKFD